MSDSNVNITISVDVSQATSSLQRLQQQMERVNESTGNSGNAFTNFGSKMSAIGDKMSAIGGKLSLAVSAPIIAVGMKVIDAGSEMTASNAKFQSTFKDLMAEVNNYIDKFQDKLQESNNKINALRADIEKIETEIDTAMEKDILEGSASSKKELSNTQARKANVESQLNVEIKKALKIKEIMSAGLTNLIPEASKQVQEDLQTYTNVVEREIYKQLQEIRQKQEELLLILQVAHNTVINEVFNYNELCHFSNMENYKRTASNEMFHNNLFMPNRSFPEFGSPLINCSNLPSIQEMLMRTRAEANAMHNHYKAEDEREQLQPAKEFKDINLQDFLDSLK